MKALDKLWYYIDGPTYSNDLGDTHEVVCPCCRHWTGVTPPSDAPANGQHKCKSWCVWCSKEFEYYY